jgi:SAM-dependent methyltransferase
VDELLVQPPLSLDEDVVAAELAERTRCTADTVVVEIGGNAGRRWAERLGVSAWYSVDPRNSDTTSGRVTSWQGRGEAMPLADAMADVVFSCNAFQFVDVGGVLRDAHRVLRPGGVLYAHFGPIWSGPDGHQLEYVHHGGHELQFWKDTLLPPYAHLRFSAAELQSVLGSALPPDLVEVLVGHVHDSTTINRLFIEDYLDLIAASPFVLREYVVSEHLDYAIETPPYDHELLAGELDLDVLGARTACATHDHHHLGVRDVRILLQKVEGSGHRPSVGA